MALGLSEAEPRPHGDAPAQATPRGGARRGRAAGRGAARPLGAPRRTAQVRARVCGRGPLPHELRGIWGSRLFPLPWSRSSQLPLPCPVVTDSGLNTTRGRTPSNSSERASDVARPGPGCECITQRERLPGRGDLAGRGGRADRSKEGGVACLRGTGM